MERIAASLKVYIDIDQSQHLRCLASFVLSMEKRRKTMAPPDAEHFHARTRSRY